ncbi:Cocaine esterase [Cytospora mali]|uniref:Cocaine esterase n=1 Tax=Cytospora mali TaxID=578113 RepID=A0A194UVD5_CYTMA|nr:Cocaine esterase [Valsa mali var. pyri (nom. inval.)]
MTDKPVPRGYAGALLDRFMAWSNGLPPETCNYTVTPVKIPLEGEEDVELLADLYQPVTKDNEPAAGTILIQCIYGRSLLVALTLRHLPPRGYNVLFVSTRGTFGSGGQSDPARTDRADGPRVVRWMRKQPWYTGTFATLGMSFLCYTQWALLGSDEPPEDMVAAVPAVGPHDFSWLIWGTGSFWLAAVDWAGNTAHQETTSALTHIYRSMTADVQGHIGIKKSVPLLDAVKAQLGDKASWLYEWMTRPDWDTDKFYEPMKQYKALETTKTAIYLPTGWQDLFIHDTMEQYQRLSERGCTVAMTIGPWSHLQAGCGTAVTKETLDWLDKYLAKRTTGDIRPAPVRINVTGANEWRWLPSWPPATKPLELYLDSQGRLGREKPQKTDESSFTFDPHDPTPTLGGNLLFGGGVANDTALAKRSDVLTFTTAPLDHDVEFLGKPRIELTHSSNNPHVDLFVRLSEVNAKGVSHNITEVYKRLDPNRAPAGQPVKIELNMTDYAHRFKKGTAIRVIVAGANFPHYSYNLGSGESQATGTTLKPATHTVHLGINSGSKIVLPVSLE